MKNMWKKLSISRKIFFCTAAMFSAVLLLLFLGQLFFYEKYYYFLTESNLQNSLNEFSNEYYQTLKDDEIKQNITEFSDENNAFIFIIDKQGNILHMSSYDMYIESSGKTYQVLLDNVIYDKNFLDLNLKEESEITITYLKQQNVPSNKTIIPQKIKYGNKTWASEQNISHHKHNKYETHTITGIISSLYLPSESKSKISIQKDEAFEAILSFRNNRYFTKDNSEYNKYTYIAPNSNSKYCIVSYIPNNQPYIIFAVKPLQSISEAVYVLKDTLVSWFLCILIIALFISIIFSKSVTKPIIKITEVTKRIKDLDFSEKCKVTSNDEVGVLAENINDMSDKLNQTIDELLKANNKLKNDIEHERFLEEKRKEFIAVISHELKTPLGIIRAYSEGLIDGVAQQEKYLNVIINETQKMDRLILDMLEDSKLETGNQALALKEADFSSFCKNIINTFKEPCAVKKIQLVEDISSDTIIKSFDRDLMERVISNFLSNAMRYSENKKIIFTLNENICSVENEGEHINDDDLDKIWDKFYCIGTSTNHFTVGTGLGLSITKNILTLHNAEFGVNNTDIGVKFWFKLP